MDCGRKKTVILIIALKSSKTVILIIALKSSKTVILIIALKSSWTSCIRISLQFQAMNKCVYIFFIFLLTSKRNSTASCCNDSYSNYFFSIGQ